MKQPRVEEGAFSFLDIGCSGIEHDYEAKCKARAAGLASEKGGEQGSF